MASKNRRNKIGLRRRESNLNCNGASQRWRALRANSQWLHDSETLSKFDLLTSRGHRSYAQQRHCP